MSIRRCLPAPLTHSLPIAPNCYRGGGGTHCYQSFIKWSGQWCQPDWEEKKILSTWDGSLYKIWRQHQTLGDSATFGWLYAKISIAIIREVELNQSAVWRAKEKLELLGSVRGKKTSVHLIQTITLTFVIMQISKKLQHNFAQQCAVCFKCLCRQRLLLKNGVVYLIFIQMFLAFVWFTKDSKENSKCCSRHVSRLQITKTRLSHTLCSWI